MTAVARASVLWGLSGMEKNILGMFADDQRSRTLAETTIRNRESILRTMSRKLGLPLINMTVHDLRRYLGRRDGERVIVAATRQTERSAMRAFYGWLVDEGIRDDNPTDRLKPIHVPKGEPRPFTSAQIDALLQRPYKRTRAMILLGYYQGFRASSIARVRGDDVDLAAGTIRTRGKGGKVRTLPLHPVVAELAQSMPREDWWFPARGGRPGHIHATSVTDLITRAKKRAGIADPTLTPHSLRHAFGTDLVEEGVDIRVVQELMMHESLATTQIYTRVSERRKREGISVLPAREIPQRSDRRAAA